MSMTVKEAIEWVRGNQSGIALAKAGNVLADALEASERRVKELEAIAADLLDYGEFYESAIEMSDHIEGQDGESIRKRLVAALASQEAQQ